MRTLALFALPTAALAVSLADFPPQVSNLPSACESIYTSQIADCSPSDFTKKGCSQGCVVALNDMVNQVKAACGNHGLTGENIIVAYLADEGPVGVCPDANTILAGMAASTSAVQSTVVVAQSTTQTTSAEATTTAPAAASTVFSSTSTASSLFDSSSSLIVATSTTTSYAGVSSTAATSIPPTSAASSDPALDSSTTTPSSSATPAAVHTSSGLLVDTSSSPTATKTQLASMTSSASPQYESDKSGGGSPFDTEGNQTSAASRMALSVTMWVSLGCLVLVAL